MTTPKKTPQGSAHHQPQVYTFVLILLCGSVAVTASQSSAPPRQSSRSQTTANVLDFGADPTGATDSLPAFSSAYNSSSAAGAIYVPCGTYKLTKTFSIRKQMTLYGEGACSILSGSGIVIVEASTTANSGVTIRDLQIRDTHGSTLTVGLLLHDVVNPTISNVLINGPNLKPRMGQGIRMDNDVIATLDHLTIFGWRHAIDLTATVSTALQITNSSRFNMNDYGIYCSACELTIEGSTIEQSSASGIYCARQCYISAISNHYENSEASSEVEIADGGQYRGFANNYTGGGVGISIRGKGNVYLGIFERNPAINNDDVTALCVTYDSGSNHKGAGRCVQHEMTGSTIWDGPNRSSVNPSGLKSPSSQQRPAPK